MKKTFFAFYDVLLISLVSASMFSVALWIMTWGPLADLRWYWLIVFALCIAVPVTFIVFGIHRMSIDITRDKVDLFYLVNHRTNSKDLLSNWVIYPSEIENVTVVKLSKDEKREHTSARFLFSKYLKLEMKYGHTKYVYVSHYSSYQINQIIHMLASSKHIRM